jgi:hypothetical protein
MAVDTTDDDLQSADEIDSHDDGASDTDVDIVDDSDSQDHGDDDSDNDSQDHGDDEEVVVTVAGESPTPEDEEAKHAPAWVRELRKQHREAQKRIKELEKQVAPQNAAPSVPKLGPKPTLEDCDYDPEVFEQRYEAWQSDRRKVEEIERQAKEQQAAYEREAQERFAEYTKRKQSLGVRDFDDAEAEFSTVFTQDQAGLMLQGAEAPELLVYYLGKNPAKAKELASISDPVKFAFKVAKLEATLKIDKRKPATTPEKVVSGTGKKTGTLQERLEAAERAAEKTGDRSEVLKLRRLMREQGR